MERELSDVMAEAVAARERALTGLTPAAAAMDGMRSQVRRRRGVRHGLQALAVVPVVGAVVFAASLAGQDPAPVPPVQTESPAPTPEPTTTSEPTPAPTPSAPELGAPVLEPGLPPFHEAPDGILDQAGPGWFLVTWQTYHRTVGSAEPSDTAVFLVDPDGTRYRLLTLPAEAGVGLESEVWTTHTLVDWEAEASTAVVRVHEGSDTATSGWYGTLDLTTGALERVVAGADRVWFDELDIAASTANGTRLWRSTAGDSTLLTVTRGDEVRQIDVGFAAYDVMPSPDGSLAWVAGGGPFGDAVVVDLRSGEVVVTIPTGETASGWCAVTAWWTDDTVLQRCHDVLPLTEEPTDPPPGPARLVTADLEQLGQGTSTLLRTLAPGEIAPDGWASMNLADGVVVVGGMPTVPGASEYECTTGAWVLDEGGARRIDLTDPADDDGPARVRFGRAPGHLVIFSSPACHEAAGPDRLVAYDVTSGTLVDLAGSPHADDGTYLGGPVSWVAGR